MEILTRIIKVVSDKHMFATIKSRLQPKKQQLLGFSKISSMRKDDEIKGDEIITGLYSSRIIAQNSPIINKEAGWIGFNVLHKDTVRVSALDIPEDAYVVYLVIFMKVKR